MPRHQSGVRRHIDVDGLTKFTDPVQRQIANIQTKYDQEVSRLKEEVSYLRGLLEHASVCNGEPHCGVDQKTVNLPVSYAFLTSPGLSLLTLT